jgi:hypothetical protein
VKTEKKGLKAHGEYPEYIYRAFTKRKYAEEFVDEGKFVLGNLKRYKQIEDSSRQDKTEGIAEFQRPGVVQSVFFSKSCEEEHIVESVGHIRTYSELGNPKFILCTSLPGIELKHMEKNFGKYIVRINNPKQLAFDITSYLESLPHKFAGGVEGCYVKYDKGNKVERKIDNNEIIKLSYSQKPEIYKEDCEFRFVAIVMGNPSTRLNARTLEINLCKRLVYAKLVSSECA